MPNCWLLPAVLVALARVAVQDAKPNATPTGWLVPTVFVAALGVTVQGAKAAWDLWMSIKTRVHSQNTLRLQELSALMNLVEGLPLAAAKKAILKIDVINLIENKQPTEKVYSVLNQYIKESVADGKTR
jgi:hypothetical protein